MLETGVQHPHLVVNRNTGTKHRALINVQTALIPLHLLLKTYLSLEVRARP